MPFRSSLAVLFCSFFSLASIDTGAQNPSTPAICPERITMNTGWTIEHKPDFCLFRYRTIPPGVTAYLTEQLLQGKDGFSSCVCNYEIKKEDISYFNCDDEPIENPNDNEYAGYFEYVWLDQGAVYPLEKCAEFNEAYPPGTFEGGFSNLRLFKNHATLGVSVNVSNLGVFASAEHLLNQAEPGYQALLSRSRDRECNIPAEEINPEILDVNPLVFENSFLFGDPDPDIRNWDVDDLVNLNETRTGIALDGVSTCLIRFTTSRSKSFDVEAGMAGKLEFTWGKQTHEIGQKHYGFFLYTPPIEAPDVESVTSENGIKSFPLEYSLKITEDGETQTSKQMVNLYPPPVVLVHGTFDNPVDCWKTPSQGGRSMFDKLEQEGYKVFAVDYSSTNGLGRLGEIPCGGNFIGSPFLGESSCFENNKQVVYKNPGGIKEALDFYRDQLDVAVCQADVIGHSMGGVLARVYASEQYEVNPNDRSVRDYTYKREDNFQSGDINRLITISSTHHGSDMAWYLYLLDQEAVNDTLAFYDDTLHLDALVEQADNAALLSAAKLGIIWLVEGIRPDAGAIMDQIPASPALRKIGATHLPAHSIVSLVDDIADIENNSFDPTHSYYYRALFTAITFYFSQNFFDFVLHQIAEEWSRLPAHLKKNESRFYKGIDVMYLNMYKDDREAFKNLYKNPLLKQWQSFLKLNGLLSDKIVKYLPADLDLADAGMGDFEGDVLDYFTGGNLELISRIIQAGFKLEELANFKDFMNRIRFLIFKNDRNDFTVRYDSQIGFDNLTDDVNKKYYSVFDHVLHSFAPRSPDIQDQVLQLLSTGLTFFNENGYPPAGRKMPVWLPDPGDAAEEITGCEAICWSGYVPSHAGEFARIAQEEDVVILARPVNPDATPLIANNRATKGMPVKGKSANWGLQKGLIPVDQRYSKLWKVYTGNKRLEEIEIFNGKVNDLLKKSKDIATSTHLNDLVLECEEGQATYEMFAVKPVYRTDAEYELRLLKKGTGEIYSWDPERPEECPRMECAEHCTLNDLDTFYVLSNPDPELVARNGGTPPIYTADYDLLAVGFFDRQLFQNPMAEYKAPEFDPGDWDCSRGLITDRQTYLLDRLNGAVQQEAHYTGGDVVHHGPENHFIKITIPNYNCDGTIKEVKIPGSPYVDYPVTAFEPNPDKWFGKTGIIRIIPMGPPGFRDIHLKEYFHTMRKRGYDLYANPTAPGWQWEYYRPYSYELGFDPRDAPDLPDGIEQLKQPENCNCLNQDFPQIQEPERSRQTPDFFEVFPNPARNGSITIRLVSNQARPVEFVMVDVLGRVVVTRHLESVRAGETLSWELPELPRGTYFIQAHLPEVQTQRLIIQ
ncbi:MAG: T9SS type A sorting domain-containing protein [Saprospiraceae bacterium]|nr:T9SS type A sorting domain-containing protein [Saprospiraceae bacterium]